MGAVVLDMSMSLDGFIAGPGDDVANPIGLGGAERLHEWLFSGDTPLGRLRSVGAYRRESYRLSPESAAMLEESLTATGAVLMGRRWFDHGEQPWGDEPPFRVPVFVVTHRARPTLTKGASTFTFVTDGLESALDRARAAAGDKSVWAGSANVAQQLLRLGLLDEMHIHLAPILLGEGRPLIDDLGDQRVELEPIRVIEAPGVTHLRDRVVTKSARGA